MLDQQLRKATHDVEVARIDLFQVRRQARFKMGLVHETSLATRRQLEAKNVAHHRLIMPVLVHYLQYREEMNKDYWGMLVLRRVKRLEACIRILQRLQTLEQKRKPRRPRMRLLGKVLFLWLCGTITGQLIILYYWSGWKDVAVLLILEVVYVLGMRLWKAAMNAR